MKHIGVMIGPYGEARAGDEFIFRLLGSTLDVKRAGLGLTVALRMECHAK